MAAPHHPWLLAFVGMMALALLLLGLALTFLLLSPVEGGPLLYDRRDWPHWRDADGDCQDTRTEVLIRDAVGPVELSDDGCHVLAGTWRSPYTGQKLELKQVCIDHVVALKEAHEQGGAGWSRTRKTDYANDLRVPFHLLAVECAVNSAKGARSEDEWLPAYHTIRCQYVTVRAAIRERHQLRLPEKARLAVTDVLEAGCAWR